MLLSARVSYQQSARRRPVSVHGSPVSRTALNDQPSNHTVPFSPKTLRTPFQAACALWSHGERCARCPARQKPERRHNTHAYHSHSISTSPAYLSGVARRREHMPHAARVEHDSLSRFCGFPISGFSVSRVRFRRSTRRRWPLAAFTTRLKLA